MSLFHFIDGPPLANVTFSVSPHTALPLFLSRHRLGVAATGCPHSCLHCFSEMGAEFWPKVWQFPWTPACHLTLHRDPALRILLYSAGLSDSAHVSVLTLSKTDVILDSSVTFRCIDFSRYLPTQSVLVMTSSVLISMYLFSLILNVYSLFYICLCAYVEGHTCHGVHAEVRGQLLALCIWLQKYQVEYIPLGICLASSWPLQNLLRHHLFWAPF